MNGKKAALHNHVWVGIAEGKVFFLLSNEKQFIRMTIEQWADWGQILEGLVGMITILLIWRELRENRQMARAASMQSLAKASAPFYAEVMQQRELAERWQQGCTNYRIA